ncbi:MFS transporter [Rhizobium sp. L1K21]|uniref:MFS transporter n=1 Tax=Rhizobium sp. L1K21 TaxID=2954933 RepID=UPI002092885A|nr:MFS transporter [Rhizobium sp. L1K21]MCO6188457.1 MFS transporter [Rhizobium sp. L1K21]
MSNSNSFGGKVVLSIGHVAGMIDMVALPLWIGNLMAHYGFSPVQAGLTVTLFLFSVVVASTIIAPIFDRIPHRAFVAGGFAVAAAAFFAVSRLPVDVSSLNLLVGLHIVAGLGTGIALSVTHGNIGRTENPHRLFGTVNVALGVLGVFFFAALPQLVEHMGADMMFVVFAATMGFAAVCTALFFPAAATPKTIQQAAAPKATPPRAVWFLIGVVICLTFNQAMVFSFLERIGAERGFATEQVNIVLVALGFVNLLPGALAAILQKRLSPLFVGFCGPILQAILAVTLSNSPVFLPYALAGTVYVSIVIFTHTFLFGLLARLETSGRAVSATPAMMMIGSCTGPAVGGAIVSGFGYGALGVAATIVSVMALSLLVAVRAQLPAAEAKLQAA